MAKSKRSYRKHCVTSRGETIDHFCARRHGCAPRRTRVMRSSRGTVRPHVSPTV